MAVNVARHQFTVEEYDRMGQAGIFSEDDRIELIEGEIIHMSPIGSRHAGCVLRVNMQLSRQVGERALVNVQNPLHLSQFSEPQPDIALLRPRPDFYALSHPTPADVLLVVEVAESSLDYDRSHKIPLYARALIPEVWLVDLEGETIGVYTEPTSGAYRNVQELRRGDSFESSSLLELVMTVESILG